MLLETKTPRVTNDADKSSDGANSVHSCMVAWFRGFKVALGAIP